MPKKGAGEGQPGREHEENRRDERESHGREDRENNQDDKPPGYERREGEQEHPRRRRMGREHAVHQQIIARRLGGGAPATPEAYAKGLEQWHQISGSIMNPPSDVKPDTEPKKPDQDDEAKGE